jgi:hypothetical protein
MTTLAAVEIAHLRQTRGGLRPDRPVLVPLG